MESALGQHAVQSWLPIPIGLTVRAPRTNLSASPASLFAGSSLPPGVEDDTNLRRPIPGPNSLNLGQPGSGTDEELALLPRMCSWGTACGSCSARTLSSSVLSPMGSLRTRSLWKPMALRSPGSSRDHEFSRFHPADERPGITSPVFTLRSPQGPGRLRMASTMSAAASLPAPLGLPLPTSQLSRRNSQQPAGASPLAAEPSRTALSLNSLPSPFCSHASVPMPDWSLLASQNDTAGKRSASPPLDESPARRVCSGNGPDHFAFLSDPRPRNPAHYPCAPSMLMWPATAPIAAAPRPGAIAAAASPPQVPNLAAGPSALDLATYEDGITMTTCSPVTFATGEELFLDSDAPCGSSEDDDGLPRMRRGLRPSMSEPSRLAQAESALLPSWSTGCANDDRDELGLEHALWMNWHDHVAPVMVQQVL